MKRFLPILKWLPNYGKSSFRGDLIAGLTVGMMLIPQGMAYAMLAGLEPIYGLYASITPLIVYAIFGTSRQLAVGPVAMVSLLVSASIASLGITEPSEYVAAALLLSFMIGAIQFLLGVIRAGFLVNFLSHPVISGFTSAAALIIGLNQLKHLFGISIKKTHYVHQILIDTAKNLGDLNAYALAIGAVAIALIILLKKINRSIPGPLVAVTLGIVVVSSFQLDASGVKIVGTIPEGLPSFQIPNLEWSLIERLMPMAVTISLIAFMESIAVAKAIQKKHKDYRVDANQELIGLGLANIAGSFFQAFPSTGGFSRTAVNDQAGAKTGMAAIISAILIALSLLFLTPLFYYLPKAILASIIMVAVFGLMDIQEVKHLWKTDRHDLVLLLITFVATLALGIENGILLGVGLSVLLIILKTTRPHYAILGKLPSTGVYRNVKRFTDAEIDPEILIFRFDARLYFANVQYFTDSIFEEIERKGDALKLIVVDTESINDIDSSGMHALVDLKSSLDDRNIQMYFTSVKGPVRDKMSQAEFTEILGENHFRLRIQEAIDAYRESAVNGSIVIDENALQHDD